MTPYGVGEISGENFYPLSPYGVTSFTKRLRNFLRATLNNFTGKTEKFSKFYIF